MNAFERARKALAGVCAQALPAESVALSIGLPGSSMVRTLRAVAPRLTAIEAISLDLLELHPGLASGFSKSHNWLMVDRQEGETLYGLRHGLGRTNIFLPQATVRFQALGSILEQFAALSFLHVGPIPGHVDLLLSVLPLLRKSKAIVWIDLPQDSDQACRQLLEAVSDDDFEIYGLSRQRLVVLPGNLLPGEAEGLLLLPRQAWVGFGLRRIALERHKEARLAGITSDLVIPVARRASPDLLARLHPAYSPPPEMQLPPKLFLPTLSSIFVSEAWMESTSNERSLVVAQTTTELTFMPLAAGTFDLGIVLNALPDGMQKELAIWMGKTRISFIWHDNWWQFRSSRPVLIEDAHRPVTLRIIRPEGGGALHIKGLELQFQERFDSAP